MYIFNLTKILTINQTVDYMARGFMIFMRGIDITRGIGRVLLKVEPVLGPEIARAYANENIVVVSGPKHFMALNQVGRTRSADFAGRKVKVYLTPC